MKNMIIGGLFLSDEIYAYVCDKIFERNLLYDIRVTIFIIVEKLNLQYIPIPATIIMSCRKVIT